MLTPEHYIRPETSTQKQLAFLVNDNLLAETMLVRLQKNGFHVNIYHTIKALKSAIENGTAYPAALVIDMDYFDFIDLPVMQNTEDLKIFAISSKNDMATRLKAAKANVSAFILKPLDANELSKKIAKAFGLEKQTIHDVLIVDDDPLTLKLCQKFLEPENIRLRFVESPMNTLEELEHHKPNLILLDYYMPDANGLDINRVIRQIYSTSEIPILFMTGSTDSKILSEIRKESHFEPISKPVSQGGLVERVLAAIT